MGPKDLRRITLALRGVGQACHWNASRSAPSRIIVLDRYNVLRNALLNGIRDLGADVERVILDRWPDPCDYLDLLACLPAEFAGDVLLIRTDGTAFLSALGRGGDRVLYALSTPDVGFYLSMHGLVEDAVSAAAA